MSLDRGGETIKTDVLAPSRRDAYNNGENKQGAVAEGGGGEKVKTVKTTATNKTKIKKLSKKNKWQRKVFNINYTEGRNFFVIGLGAHQSDPLFKRCCQNV